MDQEFFAAVTALFPLLVLTKIGDRHRRRSAGMCDHDPRMHAAFIIVAVVGEGFALAGTAKEDIGWFVEVAVIIALAICGGIFTWELIRSESPE
jgi:hypothetical protein